MFHATLANRRVIIGTYASREAAGQAIDQLMLSGFPVAQVFLVGRDLGQSSFSPDGLADSWGTVTGTAIGLKQGMLLGNLVGGTTGVLLGAGLLALPGVGQVVLSSAIAFVLLSGGIGTAAGGLTGSLIGLGLTSKQARKYSQWVSAGNFLVMVEGSGQDIDRAQRLLKQIVV